MYTEGQGLFRHGAALKWRQSDMNKTMGDNGYMYNNTVLETVTHGK